jgi:predicted DNA-binding transcriptional regulator AlpA
VPLNTPVVTDEQGAAALLGIAPATLRNQRSQGRGPKYCRLGRRIVYRVSDVSAYLDAHVVDPEAAR